MHGGIEALRRQARRTAGFLRLLKQAGLLLTRAPARSPGPWCRRGGRIAGFAPVSSGDPYGWQRDCTPLPWSRPTVFGHAFDVASRRPIGQPGACDDRGDARERPWEPAAQRPPFRLLHSLDDGIHDATCVARVRRQLLAHGYPESPPLTLSGAGRAARWHFWLDACNEPLLDFFAGLPGP